MTDTNVQATTVEVTVPTTPAQTPVQHRGRPFFTEAQKRLRDRIWEKVVLGMAPNEARTFLFNQKEKVEEQIKIVETTLKTSMMDPEAARGITQGLRHMLVVIAAAQRSVEARRRHIEQAAKKVEARKVTKIQAAKAPTPHSGDQVLREAIMILSRKIDQIEARLPKTA